MLDSDARLLLADGAPRPLTPKAFALLELLVEHRPRAVARQEILERLWPGTFVSDSNVPTLVNEVRSALGDDPRKPRYVRTVHRFGYAFSAAAATIGRDGGGRVFRVILDSVEFELQAGENVIGRDPQAAVLLEHSSVSRRHAVVRVEADGATLEDCRSKNGTFLRGQRVTQSVSLADFDEIRLGKVRLLFRIVSPAESTTTVWPKGS